MKTKTTNNIIENDAEMEEMIRELVEKAREKGIKVTLLNNSIKMAYGKEDAGNREKLKYKISQEEKKFGEKIRKFLKHYKKELIEFHDMCQKSSYFKIANDPDDRKEMFFTKLYQLLLAMKVVFEDEEASSITQERIEKIVKEVYGNKSISFRSEIEMLCNLFYTHMDFSCEGLPRYSPKCVSYHNTLKWVEEFSDFKNQYQKKNFQTSRAAMAAIWFIEKYF